MSTAKIIALQATTMKRFDTDDFKTETKKTAIIPTNIAIILSFISCTTNTILLSSCNSLYFNKALEQADIAEKFNENIAKVKGKEYFKRESISFGSSHITSNAKSIPPKSQNEAI